jgi:hypothetical protein
MLQMLIMPRVEKLESLHNIPLNGVPTPLEKNTNVTIRPRRFVTRSVENHPMYLFLSERIL